MKTKNQSTVSTDIKKQYKEKYDLLKAKLTKKDLQIVNDLSMEDKYEEGLQFLKDFESKNEIPFTYEFNDEGLTIKIPKKNLSDMNNFGDSHYTTVFSFSPFRAKKLEDGTGLAVQIGILNYKEKEEKVKVKSK